MPTIKEQIDDEQKAKNPQSTERAEVAANVFGIFEEKRTMRDGEQPLFRDRTLVDLIDDNAKRYIQFKQRPARKMKWQSNLASSTPNEKLIGILSKLATQGMEAKVVSLDELDEVTVKKEEVFNLLLKKAGVKNEDDFQLVLEMLEAAEKGTVIGFEDWFFGKAKIREIKDQDPDTGELRFSEKIVRKWNDVRSSLINLEDFFPGDIFVRPGQIKDMDDCFIRTIMEEDEWLQEFGKYPDADLVEPVSSSVNESTPFFRASDDAGENQYEVLRYFNKKTDECVIMTNGIWINFKGVSSVQPLPWNHKELPAWAAVFEPLDANFFYGRSLIDKLIAKTDSKDALVDRIIDQMTLAVSAPIITDKSASGLVRGYLQPQQVIEVDHTDGKPNFQRLPIEAPSPTGFSLVQLLTNEIEQAGVSAETIGGRSVRQKTAEEVATQREAALELISLFLKFIEKGIRDKNRLRLANMIQFYSLPSNQDTDDPKFKIFKIREEGKLIQVKITPEPMQERVEQIDKGIQEESEIIEVRPDFIRNFMGDIEIVPQSSIKMTEQTRQTLELNYQRVINSLYPDKVNRDKAFDDLNRVFKKDPNKIKARTQEEKEDVGLVPGEDINLPGTEMTAAITAPSPARTGASV